MDPERLEVDVFLDWGNWTVGVQYSWISAGYVPYRVVVLTFGPLVFLTAYRT